MHRLPAFILLFPLAACSSGPLARLTADAVRTAHPFDPVSLRVHPLTHVDASGPGAGPDQCLLVLHLELKDAYTDAVKGVGPLTVELFRPGSGPTPGIETQALVWDVPDFADPATNSARFDTATQTYRVPLLAPKWADDLLAAKPSEASPSWLKVRATLRARDAQGRPLLLADEFVIQR